MREFSGLHQVKSGKLLPIWVNSTGDVFPFFCPDLQGRFGGFQLKGGFGVFVRPFEEYWLSILKNSSFPKTSRDGFLFIRYMTNFPQFLSPPIFPKDPNLCIEEPENVKWLKDISKTLEVFPQDLGELDQSFKSGFFGNYEIQKFYGHPVKMAFFRKWINNIGFFSGALDGISEVTERNVAPYEAVYKEHYF